MVYLDNHTETSPCALALEQFRLAFEQGVDLQAAQDKIFDLTGADEDASLAFVSSGAEAIATVHWSVFLDICRKEGKCHFVTASSEDAPMLQSLKRLEELGCFVKLVPFDSEGKLDLQELRKLLGPRTALLSISWAQALSGVIHPIEEIAALAQEKGVLLHVDATYSLGKISCAFSQLPIDYLSFAGDRIHSVPSSGAVIAKKNRPLVPFVPGRSIDKAALAALGAAAAQANLSLDLMSLETARLRDEFEEGLTNTVPNVQFLYRDSVRLPNVSAAIFPHIHNEMLLFALQRRGLKASIGGSLSPHIHRLLGHFDEKLNEISNTNSRK